MEIVQKLKNSFYVDNCLTRVKSNTELYKFIQMATDIMSERKFDLREWEHNCSHLSKGEFACVNNKIISILGLQWHLQPDTLSINLKQVCEDNRPIAERKILSGFHKIVDQ